MPDGIEDNATAAWACTVVMRRENRTIQEVPCLLHTIPHYVTNQTNSQDAGEHALEGYGTECFSIGSGDVATCAG